LKEKLKELIDPNKDDPQIICKMIEYLVKNRSNPGFKKFTKHPESILFQMPKNKLYQYIDDRVISKDLTITLKFNDHEINTNFEELVNATNWDNLPDFITKVTQKKIKLEEIMSLNLSSFPEILEKWGFATGCVDCCICFGLGKKDTYSFDVCSHFICFSCVNNYIIARNLNIIKQVEIGNLLEIRLSSKRNESNFSNSEFSDETDISMPKMQKRICGW